MNLNVKNLLLIKDASENKVQKEIKKNTKSKHKLQLSYYPTQDIFINFENNSIGFNVYSKNNQMLGVYAYAKFGQELDNLRAKFKTLDDLYMSVEDDGDYVLDKNADYFEDIIEKFSSVDMLDAFTQKGYFMKLTVDENLF